MTEVDYYSLDDTRAGRIAQSVLLGAYIAAPDYSRHPGLVRCVLATGGVVLVGVLNAYDEDPANDPAELAEALSTDSPATTYGILGGIAGGLWAAHAVGNRLAKKVGATKLGLISAAALFAASEYQHSKHAKA